MPVGLVTCSLEVYLYGRNCEVDMVALGIGRVRWANCLHLSFANCGGEALSYWDGGRTVETDIDRLGRCAVTVLFRPSWRKPEIYPSELVSSWGQRTTRSSQNPFGPGERPVGVAHTALVLSCSLNVSYSTLKLFILLCCLLIACIFLCMYSYIIVPLNVLFA